MTTSVQNRLAEVAPLVAADLDGDWTANPAQARSRYAEPAVVLHDTRGLTILLNIDPYGRQDKISAVGILPTTPDEVLDDEVYNADLPSGEIGMTVKKLDRPRQIAQEITRRLLPTLTAAHQEWLEQVAAARAKEEHRQRASRVLAALPGVSEPRRNKSPHYPTNSLLLRWEGASRTPDAQRHRHVTPAATVTVTATSALETVELNLTHLSVEAARAAILAAMNASSRPQD
ncbi:hypothetical protein ACWGIR_32030 [Streptomyces albidoflavus]